MNETQWSIIYISVETASLFHDTANCEGLIRPHPKIECKGHAPQQPNKNISWYAHRDNELVVGRRRSSTGIMGSLEDVRGRRQPEPSNLVSSREAQLARVSVLPQLQLLCCKSRVEVEVVERVRRVDGERRCHKRVVLRIDGK